MIDHLVKAQELMSKDKISDTEVEDARVHALVSIAESLNLLVDRLSELTQADHDGGISLRVAATTYNIGSEND